MRIYFKVYLLQIRRIYKECEIKFQSLNNVEPICMKWRKKDRIPRAGVVLQFCIKKQRNKALFLENKALFLKNKALLRIKVWVNFIFIF